MNNQTEATLSHQSEQIAPCQKCQLEANKKMTARHKDYKAKHIDKKKIKEELEEWHNPNAKQYKGFIKFDEEFDKEMTYARQES